MRKIFLVLFVCALVLTGCTTVPPIDTSNTDRAFDDVIVAQTEVITTGNDVANTIDDIKVITDDAKVTGEIPKEKAVMLIKYVDQSAEQIKAHNEVVEILTGKITYLERSRIADNSNASKMIANEQGEIDKQKIKASIYLRWALIATGIALVLAGILWFPKLVKSIL